MTPNLINKFKFSHVKIRGGKVVLYQKQFFFVIFSAQPDRQIPELENEGSLAYNSDKIML